jgi:hypothetical protein
MQVAEKLDWKGLIFVKLCSHLCFLGNAPTEFQSYSAVYHQATSRTEIWMKQRSWVKMWPVAW